MYHRFVRNLDTYPYPRLQEECTKTQQHRSYVSEDCCFFTEVFFFSNYYSQLYILGGLVLKLPSLV